MTQLKEQPRQNINRSRTVFGAPEGQDARIISEKARALMPEDKALIHIALDDARVNTLAGLLDFFAPDVQYVIFPAWDCLPYDRVSPNQEIVAARMAALSKMLSWQAEKRRFPRIVLTTVNAALQRVMPQEALEKSAFSARTGGELDLYHLQAFLQTGGYMRSDTVREHGEYAIRGGIIDLFPPGYENPFRIDLFGKKIESIRCFDSVSQRSGEAVEWFRLQPATEVFLNEESIARFRTGYREHFGMPGEDDPLYAAVSEGRRYNGMEHWQSLFFESMETVFDYVPGAGITMDHHSDKAHDERLIQVRDFYQARKTLEEAAQNKNGKARDVSLSGSAYHPLPPGALYLEEDEWLGFVEYAEYLSPFRSPEDSSSRQDDKSDPGARKGRDFADIRALPDGDVFAALKDYIDKLSQKAFIACYSEGSKERMKAMLEAHDIAPLRESAGYKDLKKLKSGQVAIGILPLESGFVANDLAVITEQDILGDRLARRSRRKRRADNFLTEVSALAEGDLVVHIDHGVGKFVALETLEAAGTLHDCLKIEYAGGDRLFVPVENMDVLSRFGADEAAAQLDKLGGAAWQARKARVKKDLMEMADQLLEVAAARKLRKAESLEIDPVLYNEFAARFPYAETEDQERAIRDTLNDLAGAYPMDRLICGDVGFGKTEVALRAAYVAAMNGVQVAVVVPTTLLARQHFATFSARFKGTGLGVEQLSRLVSGKQAARVKEGVQNGSVNIIIGTHALLGNSVSFANLGLLVVDEEQRFGVKQKERLKEIKKNVHVLTLSATPIPRTLQMALTGVKELSLITTPPVDRLAVRSFILPFDPVVVREALLREHYRGGQSFYVFPRVRDIPEIERELKELVPEVKIIAAHGQMSAGELEERMSAFYDGQYDVLLATNIIESGIDIPSANTMIIHRADMFGLGQLYQIRGRIGRSKQRAYAYLTYPPHVRLNPSAMKRLEVMETLDTLGSGFQLASHDMDIRGAGNLLGEQQSGHIKEVGAELYQQMLEEAVAAARGGVAEDVPEKSWSPQINIGTSVLIPETYIEDLGVRMSLYRRIADLGSASPSSPRRRETELKQRGSSEASRKTADLADPVRASASGEARQRDDDFKNEIESFAAELIDRFGPLPEEVENLLDIVVIKQLCKQAGVSSVEAGPKGAVVAFHNNAPPNVEGLMRWITEKGGAIKLRPDQTLVVIRQWDSPARRVKGIQSLMKELASLV